VLMGADPQAGIPELDQHLQSCRDCPQWRSQMLGFDIHLRRAMALDGAWIVGARSDVGFNLAAGAPRASLNWKRKAPVFSRSRTPGVGIGMAAALLMGFAVWLGQPDRTLAAEVVGHIENEPGSWSQTEPLPAEQLNAILRASGVKLSAPVAPVVYARSCEFMGQRVPHFVVTTESGPITIMVLTHTRLRSPERFQRGGYRGLLLPLQRGSIAVVSHNELVLDAPANLFVRALDMGLERSDEAPSGS
jgi:Protein of unknown function (DUF3379)